MTSTVVFDTNILISAVLSTQGNSFRCLALAHQGVIQSVTCEAVLDELRDKLLGKFKFSLERAQKVEGELRRISHLVVVTGTVKGVSPDPKDDMILECAVMGGATHIVTGDKKHLLPLGNYQGVAIVSAADFLKLMSQTHSP